MLQQPANNNVKQLQQYNLSDLNILATSNSFKEGLLESLVVDFKRNVPHAQSDRGDKDVWVL